MSNIEEQIKREPVQAIMTLIMRLCSDDQKKVIYEKLGRRVPPSPTDESALRDEAEKRYSYGDKNITLSSATYNSIMDCQRSAYLEGRRKSIAEQQQMGLLLMDKDGEIEGLKDEIASKESIIYGIEEGAAQWKSDAENWKKRFEMVYSALDQLVALKNIKDTEGDTFGYRKRKPLAWHFAKQVIQDYAHLKPPTINNKQ